MDKWSFRPSSYSAQSEEGEHCWFASGYECLGPQELLFLKLDVNDHSPSHQNKFSALLLSITSSWFTHSLGQVTLTKSGSHAHILTARGAKGMHQWTSGNNAWYWNSQWEVLKNREGIQMLRVQTSHHSLLLPRFPFQDRLLIGFLTVWVFCELTPERDPPSTTVS